MKTIDIKGKPYITVNERLKYFRENYKNYRLCTKMMSNENGVCIFRATIYNPEGYAVATGFAYEKEGSSFINKTSYIENCETSAWGRALGNFGIGIDTSVASADEVANAIKQQESGKAKEADEGVLKHIAGCRKVEELQLLRNSITDEDYTLYRDKFTTRKAILTSK